LRKVDGHGFGFSPISVRLTKKGSVLKHSSAGHLILFRNVRGKKNDR
jgi:hypothetical protein